MNQPFNPALPTNVGNKLTQKIRQDCEEEYKKYQNLIYQLAHRFAATTEIEFEELVSCANLEFMKCRETYDPLMASFSTYLTIKVKGLFIELAKKKYRRLSISVSTISSAMPDGQEINILEMTMDAKENPEERYFFKEILQGLSQDAKEVVKIVFETPLDLFNLIISEKKEYDIRKNSRNKIQIYLREKGWTYCRIWRAFKEIKKAL